MILGVSLLICAHYITGAQLYLLGVLAIHWARALDYCIAFPGFLRIFPFLVEKDVVYFRKNLWED